MKYIKGGLLIFWFKEIKIEKNVQSARPYLI